MQVELTAHAAPILERAVATPKRGAAWRDAFLAWLGQHVLLLVLVCSWQTVLITPSVYSLYIIWTRWDGAWYAGIARGGYHRLLQAAFFPLYPALEHMLSPLVGGNVDIAGLVISNICGFFAFLALRVLVERELGVRVARRTLLYYACFPTTLFFAAEYTESLFLLLSVMAFLALRKHRWLLAGVLVTLATLTRAPGLLLLAPLLWEALADLRARWADLSLRQRWHTLLAPAAATLLPLLTFAGLQLYLDWRFGVPNAMTAAMRSSEWLRYLDWPWVGILSDLDILFFHTYHGLFVPNILFALLWIALACAMLAPARHTLPKVYVLYTCVCLLQVLLTPIHTPGFALTSVPRYMLVAFPCVMLLATWGVRFARVNRLILAMSLALLTLFTLFYAYGGFVG